MNDRIENYLYYGYAVKAAGPGLSGFDCSKVTDLAELNLDDLVRRGVLTLKRVFEKEIDSINGQPEHIVPLSGGLDSRAILMGLIEAGFRERTTTVTFGTPGTLDYEIGIRVARALGIRYVSLDLRSLIPNTYDLVDTVSLGGDWTYLFDAYFNRLIPKYFGKDPVYWSGFMGDPIGGSLLSDVEAGSWHEATRRFVKTQKWAKSVLTSPPGYDPMNMLPPKPLKKITQLDPYERVNFDIRQEHCIRPIVMVPGFDYKTPFMNPDWIGFMLSVPRKFRYTSLLYHRILLTAYSKGMALPTKTNYGLPLQCSKRHYMYRRIKSGVQRVLLENARLARIWSRPHIMTNYIDFDWALRHNDLLARVVHENLMDLDGRRILDWIDISRLWERHQAHRSNHADALVLLAGLEVNMKIGSA